MMPQSDDVAKIHAALLAYEQYLRRGGKPVEGNQWRAKLARQGLALPDPPPFDRGDACED